MKLFTYGTLMQGGSNNHLLDGADFMGPATTEPGFTMLHLGGFPGIVPEGNTTINGELYEIDERILRILDVLEGHPDFYRRRDIGVCWEGMWIVATCYLLPREWLKNNHPIIESGNWRDAVAIRPREAQEV